MVNNIFMEQILKTPPPRAISEAGNRWARAAVAFVETNLRSPQARAAFAQIKPRLFQLAREEGEYWPGPLAEVGYPENVISAAVWARAHIRGEIEHGEIGSVRAFLRQYKLDGTYPTADNVNILMRALATRNPDMVSTIAMECGALRQATDDYGRDTLMHAILTGDLVMVQEAIRLCGIDRVWKDSFDQTILNYAKASGNPEIRALVAPPLL